MKNKLTILLCASFFMLGMSQAWTETRVLDFIKIIVNNEILTNNEVQAAIATNRAQIMQSVPEGPEREQQLLQLEKTTIEYLINELLVLDRAKVLNIEVSNAEIEQHINRLAQENPQVLKNYTAQILKEMVAKESLKQRAIAREIDVKIRVTDEEIQKLCQENTEQTKEIVIAQILFRGSEEEARRKEILVRKALSEGEDFADLARSHSDDPNARKTGGIIGSFQKGELLPVIDTAAFSLKLKELSGLVKTEIGYHLIYLQDVKYNKEIDCSNPQESEKIQYYNQLFVQKHQTALQTYLKTLREAAQVVIH